MRTLFSPYVKHVATLLSVGVMVAVLFSFVFPKADAQTTTRALTGYAWSSTIGWVDVSGVKIDSATGAFSGYGWSSNIGWVSFQAGDLASCPGSNCAPKLNADNSISGFARACAGTVNKDCRSASRTDGWDGWVGLSGLSYNVAAKKIAGYAWGADVVGWVDFSGVGYDPGSTVCPGGQINFPACDQCPAGKTLNTTTNTCDDDTTTCPAGKVYNPVTRLCDDDTTCPVGEHWDAALGRCVPDTVFCPAGTHYDPIFRTCVPDTTCTAGAPCTTTTPNKCGLFNGTTICEPTGPRCVPLDPTETCTVCDPSQTLCRGVCLAVGIPVCPPTKVKCTTPSGAIINEGESVVLYDILRGISTNNNCSHHQERRVCQVDPTDPTKGVLSGKPNPTDDKHVYPRCSPFFQEV